MLAVRNADTGQRLVFRARLVARRGAHDADFEARVVFPTGGRWSYAIGDRQTTFKRHWGRWTNAPIRRSVSFRPAAWWF